MAFYTTRPQTVEAVEYIGDYYEEDTVPGTYGRIEALAIKRAKEVLGKEKILTTSRRSSV